jgi:pimeloyl-ACP methyl ester carboxylesterase
MFKKIAKLVLWVIGISSILLGSLYFYNINVVESKSFSESAPGSVKYVKTRGERLAYQLIDNSADTTVVFVGGLSAWSGTWDRSVDQLNKSLSKSGINYNYLTLDLPPFGYSEVDTRRDYFRSTQAGRIKAVVEALRLNSVVLVAHSYGAGPSAEYAMAENGIVEKFVIIDGALNLEPPSDNEAHGLIKIDMMRHTLIALLMHSDSFAKARMSGFVYVKEKIDDELLRTYTRYFDTKHSSRRLSDWALDFFEDPLDGPSSKLENYSKINVPVVLIWGDKDSITPLSQTNGLMRTIPNVELVVLKDIGHIPMVESHLKFDKALADALQPIN